jgi:hypothetical protein
MTALPTASGHRRLLPWLILAVVAVLFLLHADRRSFLGDDAYISFRYAGNWAAGEGPVFNPGERVEGYTNFLWVALLAGGIRLGVPPEALAPTAGTLAGLGVLALTAWIGLRRHGRGDRLAWLAPAALALHPSFAAWSTGGLETQLFSFLLLAAAARFLIERERVARSGSEGGGSERGGSKRWRSVHGGSALLFALATLTRPEGALFAAMAGVAAVADALRRRRPLAPLVAWGALYLVPVLAHLTWRRAYYGAWLPNTFRAKVPEPQWEQGVDYVLYFLTGTGVVWLLPLLAAGVLVRPGFRQVLFAVWLAAHAAYLVAVGGDFMEFRFVVPMLPYLFLLTADGVRRLAELAGRRTRRASRAVAGAASAVVLVVVALPLAGVPSFPPSWVAPPADFASVRVLRDYAAHRVVQGRALAMLIEADLLPADLHVVTGAVGALPYLTGWPILDHHGLTDAEVAANAPTYRRVAHRRNVSPEQIRRKGAEVVMLSHKLVEVDPRALPTMVETSRQWLESYNRRAEEPRDRLRLVCRQPLPGMWMIFGTHLDDAALDRRLGRLPRCPPWPEA